MPFLSQKHWQTAQQITRNIELEMFASKEQSRAWTLVAPAKTLLNNYPIVDHRNMLQYQEQQILWIN